jgi:hypothetical protein
LGALVVLVGGLSASAQSPSLVISVAAVNQSVVGQGLPFEFRIDVANQSPDFASQTLSVSVVPASEGPTLVSEPKTFAVLQVSLASGASASYTRSVVTSQWFEELGAFQVQVETEDGVTASMPFDVTRSPIRVPRFEDVSEEVGVLTTLADMTCGRWSEGAAWADVDGDRDLDLFVGDAGAQPVLWINSAGHFTDETAVRGLAGASVILGAAFGDYDNDGDPDLYLANDGPNQLFRNDGTGNFSDVTLVAGVGDDGPGHSASWGDYDADGHLDLYVANHVQCAAGITYYADKLYHNEGDGTFTDRTDLLHAMGSTTGAGFQAAFVDYDNDGDQDVYLANDNFGSKAEPNFLWRNEGNGQSFTDVSVESNTAVLMNSMGIGIGDYDRDMDFDIAVSNIRAPSLFRNEGDGTFEDIAEHARVDRDLHDSTTIAVTWGTVFGDFNNDGWEDLYLAAGRLLSANRQPNEFFTNGRDGRFLDHSAPSGADDPRTGRGVALADFDRDGRLDIFITNMGDRPALLRNVTPFGKNHWLEVDTKGTISNKDGCGARLILVTGNTRLLRQVFCGSIGLASSSDPTVHFGLGRRARVDKLIVRWPSGARSVRRDFAADRFIRVKEPS